MNSLATLVTLVVVFAYFDRFCGGGIFWHKDIPGRPIYYVFAGAALVGLFVWFFAPEDRERLIRYSLLLGAWLAWRWPGWKLFGGSLAPKNAQEGCGTVARHSILFLALLAVPVSQLAYAAPAVAFLVVAYTILHMQIRQASLDGKDIIPAVELTRGVMYGLFVFCVLGSS